MPPSVNTPDSTPQWRSLHPPADFIQPLSHMASMASYFRVELQVDAVHHQVTAIHQPPKQLTEYGRAGRLRSAHDKQ